MDPAIKAALIEEFVPYELKVARFEELTPDEIEVCRELIRSWRSNVSDTGYEIIEKVVNDPKSELADKIMTKVCGRCHVDKPFTEFYKLSEPMGNSLLSPYCRQCISSHKSIQRAARKWGFIVDRGP